MTSKKMLESLIDLICEGITEYGINEVSPLIDALLEYFDDLADINNEGQPNFAMKIHQAITQWDNN